MSEWNFPPEMAEIAELERELDDLYNAGVGGVEIGQGGVPTFEQLAAILRKAIDLGIKVSVKYRDGAPVPGTFAADHDYVPKMVNVTDVLIPAGDTYTGKLAGEGTIVAVLAYQCVGSTVEEIEGGDTQIMELVRRSVIDLTSTITGTNIDFFVPCLLTDIPTEHAYCQITFFYSGISHLYPSISGCIRSGTGIQTDRF